MTDLDWPFLIALDMVFVVVALLFVLRRRRVQGARLFGAASPSLEGALSDPKAQHAMIDAVVRHANDGLLFHDMQARILWANDAYCRMMGFELHEIIGRRPQEFCFPPEVRPSEEEIENFAFDPKAAEFHELTRRLNVRKNGERFWHEFNLSMVEISPGEHRVILVSRDVTEHVAKEQALEQAREKLAYAATHDALTGLNNRAAFLDIAQEVLDADRSLGLAYVDLDRFKQINDTMGHAAGDAVLCHVADAIRAACSDGTFACRLGGDEFLLASPDIFDLTT
ncbi:MAG: diguanylate cyclase, partial [Pseudomonadota bacterium]